MINHLMDFGVALLIGGFVGASLLGAYLYGYYQGWEAAETNWADTLLSTTEDYLKGAQE